MIQLPATSAAPKRLEGLPLALLLSLGLMLLSFARIIGDSQSMAFRNNVLDSMLAGSLWGTALLRNLILFGLALVLVHAVFALVCWLLSRLSIAAYGTRKAKPSQHVLLWFIALTFALLVNNAVQFPRSSLGEPYAQLLLAPLGPLSLGHWLVLAACVPALVTAALGAWKIWQGGAGGARAAIAAGVALLLFFALTRLLPDTPERMAAHEKPNIILIGLDSLRCDLLSKEAPAGLTPTLTELVRNGTWFSDAITPLARTFPSMTSMLTGRQPHSTGAFMNLLPRDMIKEGDTLARILGRAGYRSVYATDEVRFSNIDASYGFDQVITPPIGASEFLITMVGDTPLSNVLVNTGAGKWLFPHLYANRGAALTYDPDRFLARVRNEAEFSQPLFLTLHLTLSHWPYTWKDAPLAGRDPEARWPQYYLNVARRADQQLGDALALLEQRGALENALVIVYSDHGEAFGSPGEALTPDNDPLIATLGAIPGWGHGGSVLSPHQYRVVLAMRGFGRMASRIPAGRISDAPVTVMDVAPTVVSLTAAPTNTPFDGRDLLPLLGGDADAAARFAGRVRFTETEFSPANIADATGKVSQSAVATASQVYRIDSETDRIEVKPEKTHGLLEIRQYAAIGKSLLVAAIPHVGATPSHRFIVVDNRGGLPRRITEIPDARSPPELLQLWQALFQEFGSVLPPEGSVVDVANPAVASNGH